MKKKFTGFLAMDKKKGIDSVHPRTMKIVLYTKDPCFRASPGHGGLGVFFEFLVTHPPRRRSVGGAESS